MGVRFASPRPISTKAIGGSLVVVVVMVVVVAMGMVSRCCCSHTLVLAIRCRRVQSPVLRLRVMDLTPPITAVEDILDALVGCQLILGTKPGSSQCLAVHVL